MNHKDEIIAALLAVDKATMFLSYHDPKHPLFKRLLTICNGDVEVLIDHLRNDVDKEDCGGYPRAAWWAIMALHTITGHNPVKEEHYGMLSQIIQSWLEWADKR